MARPGTISPPTATVARADVTAVDSAAINNTNIPRGAAVDCAGWESVVVFPRFTGGTSPTVTVAPLYYAQLAPGETNSWMVGQPSIAMAEGVGEVVRVCGRPLYSRVTALTGSPTSVTLLVIGWQPLRYDGPQVS